MKKILGIGVGIVENSRIENIMQKTYNSRFVTRVLHFKEREEFNKKIDITAKSIYLSSRFSKKIIYIYQIYRWAYKEALTKASGRKDLVFSKIHLIKDANGFLFFFLD